MHLHGRPRRSYFIDQQTVRLRCWHPLGTAQSIVFTEHLVVPSAGLGTMWNPGI